MNIKINYRSLQAIGVAAVLGLGVVSQASANPTFTVNPLALSPNHVAGGSETAFTADFITGNSSTLVTLDNTGPFPVGTQSTGTGWVNFSTFVDNGTNVLGNVSGLNNTWQMWAEFTYTTELASGTYASSGSVNNVIALHADFWVDPSIATLTTFTSANIIGGVAATVTHGADSYIIGTADLIVGVADINALGGTGFNATALFNLNSAGSNLFTSPIPFYNVSFTEFNNTSGGVAKNANYLSINQTSGGIDFNKVPEPTTLVLLGIGLLGFCASMKRRV